MFIQIQRRIHTVQKMVGTRIHPPVTTYVFNMNCIRKAIAYAVNFATLYTRGQLRPESRDDDSGAS
jgi:hypothetical protein